MPSADRALDAVHALYRRLPVLGCRGLCAHSCVPVAMSRAEAVDLGLPDPDRPTTEARGPLGQPRCSLLTSHGSCGNYRKRPMICRLWGVADAMRCPHGCTPRDGYLTDTETIELMLASLVAGGHALLDNPRIAEGVMDLARQPGVADLVLRLVRGDPTAALPLQRELRRFHRSRAPVPEPQGRLDDLDGQ